MFLLLLYKGKMKPVPSISANLLILFEVLWLTIKCMISMLLSYICKSDQYKI